MIFSIQSLQEKYIEPRQDLYLLFKDHRMINDKVSRFGIWFLLSNDGLSLTCYELTQN